MQPRKQTENTRGYEKKSETRLVSVGRRLDVVTRSVLASRRQRYLPPSTPGLLHIPRLLENTVIHHITEPDALQTDTRDSQSTHRVQLARLIVVLRRNVLARCERLLD